MPYEGVPREREHDLERLALAIAIAAAMLIAAWAFAAPVSSKISSGVARTSAPSAALVAPLADSDKDRAPGEAESELAIHPVAAR